MLKSMTGFGSVIHDADTYTIAVDVRAINSKGQDFAVKLPKQWADKEVEIKSLMAKILDRGKVNVSVEVQKKQTIVKPKFIIQSELFEAYVKEIRKNTQAHQVDERDMLRIVLSQPDVLQVAEETDNNENEWQAIYKAVEEALLRCDAFRQAEGEALRLMLSQYVSKIRYNLELIKQLDPERIKKLKDRLHQKLSEYIPRESIDENRFEQELLYYIEKMDIEEEKVRLLTHLDYFEETMQLHESVGKKLGFIAQEIGREINTIGSKCNDSAIQKLVVEMKEELEKIKEQSLNVL